MSGSSNNNPNLYTITATVINMSIDKNGDGTHILEAVIGDPRGPAEDISSLTGGGSTSLTGYRPAGNNTKNVVAPQFMSASSYGKTSPVTYEGAVKRCASYQEYGYPAGRWRLPTVAEVAFMQELNGDGMIPSLFNPDEEWGYWAAGGEILLWKTSSDHTNIFKDITGLDPTYKKYRRGYPNQTSGDYPYYYLYKEGTGNSAKQYLASVRCVYDTWYWGNEHSATTNNSWLGFKTSLSDTF